MNQSKSTSRNILLFTIGMITTKLSSFLLNIALSYRFGASYYSDAIIIAMNIPVVLFSGFISSMAMCFVPLYKKELNTNGKKEANSMTSLYINVFTLFIMIVCVLLFVFSDQAIKIFASGLAPESLSIASSITKFVAIASIFNVATGILQGYLQANNKFMLVSLSALPVNSLIAVSVFLSNRDNVIEFVGLGLIISYYFQFVLFFVSANRSNYRWSNICTFRDERITNLFSMILPVFLGTIIYDINSIIDKNFASFLVTGSISVLDYSYKVAGAAQGILAYPIITVLYTQLSEKASKEDNQGLIEITRQGIKQLSVFMIPVLTGMLCTSEYIITIIFGRGQFNEAAIKKTSICLILYLVGMYAVSYRAFFEKVLYSLRKTKITLLNTVITVVINVILDWALYRSLGCYGLAVATSVSLIISAIFLYIYFKKLICFSLNTTNIKSICKILIASILMGAVIIGLRIIINYDGILQIGLIPSLAVLVIVGFISYYFILLLLKEDSLQRLLKSILLKKK